MPEQPKLGYRLIDADNHYYEPYDCFIRHLEPAFADRSVHVVKDGRGLGRLYFGQRKLGFMRVIQSDYTGAPGSLHELFAGEIEHGFAQTEVINAHDFPAMMHKAPRLQLMDEQGLEATLMFPTVAVAVEHELHDDVDACYANLRAFNKWIEEDWGYGADGRVFGAPMLSLLSPEHAVAELDRVLGVGANMVHVKAGPAYGHSPADPAYDPFWARLNKAGLPVAIHSGDSGYNELWSVRWGKPAPAAAAVHDPVPVVPGVRRQADLGHAGQPDPQQPVRPVPAAADAEHRERLGLGARPAAGHGQGGQGKGGARPSAGTSRMCRARCSGSTSGSRPTSRRTRSRSAS